MIPADPASAAPHEELPRAAARPRSSLAASHPDLVFWLSLALLNGLLFLPIFLLNLDDSSFLPWQGAAGQSVPAVALQLFAWRNNLDIFRLSLEVLLLAALWVNVPWLWRGRRPRVFLLLFAAVYALALSYAIYESISLSLYQIDPVFYAQYKLAVEGIQFVIEQLHWPWTVYAGGALLALAAIALLLRLTRLLIGGAPPQQLSRPTRLVTLALVAWALLAPLALGSPLASPKSVVSSLAVKLQKNVAESLALRREIVAFDSGVPLQAYDYSRHMLLEKPDIYLIFVESYGSVLYKRPDWRSAYQALLAELEQELAGEGWHAATALSESPTWGGGSWMAYTSALFGYRIDSDAQYRALLDKYQDETYPDLGRYLQSQGYYSLRVDSIARELREEEWLKYRRFYGVDDLQQFSSLDYQGPRYGWGPAPPDQYVLWRTETAVASQVQQPLFLFYITQNSHFPWVPQPALVEDWRTLNQPADDPSAPLPDQIPRQAKRRNYLNAVDYQLRFLTDFIRKAGRNNAIYVLIGDHQPQQVSRHDDGFETPVHIISRDAGVVQSLQDYGFVDGLTVQDLAPVMRHEGFYSLFVRTLLANYGQGGRVLPPYLPDGIVLDVPHVEDDSVEDEHKETRLWPDSSTPRN